MLAVAGVSLAFPVRSFGAAQLAAGATTSAQPTSTNPQQRQLQITFDPRGDFNVTSFQLSVMFDPTFLEAMDLQFVDPYTQTTGHGPLTIDNTTGMISFIAGQAPVEQTQGGDVNIFLVNFQYLRDDTTFDDPFLIKIFASEANNDFIGLTQPDAPTAHFLVKPTDDPGIAPTVLFKSFNELAAEVAPMPQAWIGGVVLGSLVLLRRMIRRRRPIAG
jgi:hypothetical protein